MTSTVCTLVEGDYHLGLGALANSLYFHGYRGIVWVGTRGALPPWAQPLSDGGHWHEYTAAPDLQLRFVPLATKAHLTNFKSEFMIDLLERLCPDAERLFYFDPDIVVKCPWAFFERWADQGIALVEDVNSPMPETHPRRGAWKTCLARRGRAITREIPAYVNGGYIGLTRENRAFLKAWLDAMNLVGEEVGGLENSMFSFGADKTSESYPFSKTDQDALNIAVMTSSEPISIMGSEAMDFREGGWTMSHALGRAKPWHGRFVRRALQGFPPSTAAKLFVQHLNEPISIFSRSRQGMLRWSIKVAALIGRFYRRN